MAHLAYYKINISTLLLTKLFYLDFIIFFTSLFFLFQDANKPTENIPVADFVKCAGTFSVPGAMTGPQDLKGHK